MTLTHVSTSRIALVIAVLSSGMSQMFQHTPDPLGTPTDKNQEGSSQVSAVPVGVVTLESSASSALLWVEQWDMTGTSNARFVEDRLHRHEISRRSLLRWELSVS